MTTFVSVESPYSNSDPKLLQRNINYAIMACKDCASNYNEAPYASHVIHTQVVSNQGVNGYVNDDCPDKFGLGRDAAIELTNTARRHAQKIVFYTDFGFSGGMQIAKDVAEENGIPTEDRKLPMDMMQYVTGHLEETKSRFKVRDGPQTRSQSIL